VNLKALATRSAVVGVTIAAFTGSAIARQAGFESWLIAAFALGILLLSQGPILRLQQEVRDLKARLPKNGIT
jgi:hypothetical protein